VCNESTTPDGKIVLGVISLGRDFLQPTVPVHQGWWRYWQKHGLFIWAGHQTVTITVPKAWRNRAAIIWGVNVGIVSTLRLPGTLCRPAARLVPEHGTAMPVGSTCGRVPRACRWRSVSDDAAR
jgi:hypothetical protein